MTRRPRLPMMLGLAFLTVAAHTLVAAMHVGAHLARGADGVLLSALAAIAPVAAMASLLRGHARAGAAILAIVMLAGAGLTFYQHFWLADDAPDTALYAGIVQMLLAFQLQGIAAGAILAVKPEQPRPRAASG